MDSVSNENEENHFDPKTGAPITRPLNTLEDVYSWKPRSDFFNVATVLLTEQDRKLGRRPRTLVCHDMKGGYIQDRFVQGVDSNDCYIIYHWYLIDIFVYFSHHFVTMPPPCWTNAAHTNGVPVLGTVITEGSDGGARCSQFLKDTASWQSLANQLVDIAEYYRFDGWFLNIENNIEQDQVKNLEEFVKYLKLKIHQRIPNSLVIWYDNVISSGFLAYQNELNAENRVFFDACDGIFVNYSWSKENLVNSVKTAGQDRQADVYVGVDVFGRDALHRGGYKSNEAFKVIREVNLSAALFAPGWVMEKFGHKNFFENQDKFWCLLAPYCTVHAVVRGTPFVTSFGRGCGKTVSIDGKVLRSHPWTNLSAQQCQPIFSNTFSNLGTKGTLAIKSVAYTVDEAYNGGGCLLIAGLQKSTGCLGALTKSRRSQEVSKSVVRLFKADFDVTEPLLLSFAFKLYPKNCLDVALQLDTNKKSMYLLLCPDTSDDQGSVNTEGSDLTRKLIRRYGIPKSQTTSPSSSTSPIVPDQCRLFEPVTGDLCTTIKQTEGSTEEDEDGVTWCTRHYLIDEEELVGCKVQEVSLICAISRGAESPGAFKLYLGEIKIFDPQVLKRPLPYAQNLQCHELEKKSTDKGHLSVSLTLTWDCPISDGCADDPAHSNIFRVTEDSNIFLGQAFVEAYRVCQIHVSKTCSSMEFIVQVVTRSGLNKPLNESTRFKLKLQ